MLYKFIGVLMLYTVVEWHSKGTATIFSRESLLPCSFVTSEWCHYITMAYKITGVSTVCSIVCSSCHQRKHQHPILLVLCGRNPPVTRTIIFWFQNRDYKMFCMTPRGSAILQTSPELGCGQVITSTHKTVNISWMYPTLSNFIRTGLI